MAARDCDVVSILNSDDHYAPDRFEKCLPLLESNPDKQVAVSALRIIDENDADLAAAGFPREAVDTVICTHLHFDHVGWNTMLVDAAGIVRLFSRRPNGKRVRTRTCVQTSRPRVRGVRVTTTRAAAFGSSLRT